MMVSPPLRFLVLVLGGWASVRPALLGSAWLQDAPVVSPPAPAGFAAEPVEPEFAKAQTPSAPSAAAPVVVALTAPKEWPQTPKAVAVAPVLQRPRYSSIEALPRAAAPLPPLARPIETHSLPTAPPVLATLVNGASRWSASAWVFGRRGEAAGLAPGGTLGGSQAGARLAYRLSGDAARPLVASLRAYAPLDRPRGAEAAVGLDWKPLAKVPVHLLVERRHALGEEGRSAFAATSYGGVSEVAAGAFRIDAYGQAGVVGVRSRDLFADGSATLSLPVAGAKVGAGIWAAAQPGVSRVDVGPQASVRLPGPSPQIFDGPALPPARLSR